MLRKSAFMFALVLLSVLALSAVVIAADNNVGTWKLNLAKSTYGPGQAPKSQTLTIEAWGEDGLSICRWSWCRWQTNSCSVSGEYDDGKDYPFTEIRTPTCCLTNELMRTTWKPSTKLKGKVTIAAKAMVSADGKTRTVTQKGHQRAGPGAERHLQYEKQ